FLRRQHRVEHEPVHDTKIAGIEWNVDFRKIGQGSIVQVVRDSLKDALFSFLPDRVDDVKTLFPLRKELRQYLWRVLKVGVEDRNSPARRVPQPRPERNLMAEIPRQADSLPARISPVAFSDQCPGAVT